MKNIAIIVICYFFLCLEETQAQVFYDDTSSNEVLSIAGGANWDSPSSGNFAYNNNGNDIQNRALVYSTIPYQSEDGFKLTIEYTTESIEDISGHNFSFGLISDETDLSAYSGFNPFREDTSVYSVGANLTTNGDTTARGLNFTNGTSRVTLDKSGTSAQFVAGETTKVTIEIGIGGYWSYRINDVYEESGVLLEGFDLSKNYHVAVYGQSNNEKSIQSIVLEKRYAAGERAVKLRGTWSSEIEIDLLDDRIKNLKTLDRLRVTFTNGAVLSGLHYAPNKLFDVLTGGDAIAPAWGDLNSDTPDYDKLLADILKGKAAGFSVKAYTNSENFVGTNADYIQPFADSWLEYCDTNPTVQAFINSKPYHTGIWNSTTEQYEDATDTFPMRKYMFCYAEYFLKDYALRYGEHFDSWIFDDGATMEQNGDNATSGLVEEQRIYQAYANAVHAGNPEIPIAFNNGRSTSTYNAFPFAHPVRFDDFTFGHAFGGNNDHASKTGSQFNNNYKHVTRMTATNGYVHTGGNWDWDDKIVGNFHSKLSTAAWKYGSNQAWEQADFNQWNLEAMHAGGCMTWGGSYNRAVTTIYDWVYVLLEGLDAHLSVNENPGPPKWTRAHTILPPAKTGELYSHTLTEEKDFWDPEGDAIIVSLLSGAPSWLSIKEDPNNTGHWILSGVPNAGSKLVHKFEIQATDVNNDSGVREVELQVIEGTSTLVDTKDGKPLWKSNRIEVELFKFQQFDFTLTRGLDFEDFDGDDLTISIVEGEPWLSLVETAPNVWNLEGVAECTSLYEIELALSDGTNTTNTTVAISVIEPQFLDMTMKSISSASWDLLDDGQGSEAYVYSSASQYWRRAILYSNESFQSDEGFVLKVNYNTGLITDTGAHNFSFGLVSTDTDMENYQGLDPDNNDGLNPFGNDTSVYSLGVNLTLGLGATMQGLNFTNESTSANLDVSGTNAQFVDDNVPTEVTIEIGKNGTWSYSIGEVEEASGIISEGFDLTKSYRVVIYGQDDNGGGKTIHSINLNTCSNDRLSLTDILPSENQLFLYKNPVLDKFKINLVSDKTAIYDVTGRVVKYFYTETDEFDVSELKTGVYIARFNIQGQMINKKIIKK